MTLDDAFAALAAPTRRAILARLAGGDATVGELACPFDISLPAISRHLRVLEDAGLITRHRSARQRVCRLNPAPLRAASEWLESYKRLWDENLDRLNEYLDQLQRKEGNMSDDIEFVVTRTFNAPREQVWKAWTDLDSLSKWWGPKGFGWIAGTLDLRPGGRFHYGMRSPTGEEMWGKFDYREVDVPHKLVFTNSFSDKDGNTVRAPFASDWPLYVLNILTLEGTGSTTALTLRGSPCDATDAERARFKAMHPSMTQGWKGTMEQLEKFVTGQC